MKNRWKIILIFLGIVLFSGLVGAKIGGRIAYNKMTRHNNPATWNETAMRALDHHLNLTPEQRQKIQALMDARVEELQSLRKETIGKTNTVVEHLVAEIRQELTPEQIVEFDKLKDQRGPTTLDTLKVEPRKR